MFCSHSIPSVHFDTFSVALVSIDFAVAAFAFVPVVAPPSPHWIGDGIALGPAAVAAFAVAPPPSGYEQGKRFGFASAAVVALWRGGLLRVGCVCLLLLLPDASVPWVEAAGALSGVHLWDIIRACEVSVKGEFSPCAFRLSVRFTAEGADVVCVVGRELSDAAELPLDLFVVVLVVQGLSPDAPFVDFVL